MASTACDCLSRALFNADEPSQPTNDPDVPLTTSCPASNEAASARMLASGDRPQATTAKCALLRL